MSTRSHAISVMRDRLKTLKSIYGNGWHYLNPRMRESEMMAGILHVINSQDDCASWSDIKEYMAALIIAANDILAEQESF